MSEIAKLKNDIACKQNIISHLAEHNIKLQNQLKSKEQECEELKKCLLQVQNASISLNKQLDKLKEKNEKISKGYAELTDIVSSYMDDFTGYNEELGGFDIVLCVKELMEQLDQLKAENDLYKNAHKTEQDRRRSYENALTEIKEIAEPFCDACQEFEPEKNKICMYCNCGKILQKISECEVENAR